MPTPSPQQEVWLFKHRIWNLFEDGASEEEVRDTVIREGRKPPIVEIFLQQHYEAERECVHDVRSRNRILRSVKAAIDEGDPDQIVEAMDPACDDDRTLYKVFVLLSNLLYAERPTCRWAAFGLSKMVGFGDLALMNALQHEDEPNRFYAAFALGTMGADGRGAIDDLKQSTRDSSEKVRQIAKKALSQIRRALSEES